MIHMEIDTCRGIADKDAMTAHIISVFQVINDGNRHGNASHCRAAITLSAANACYSLTRIGKIAMDNNCPLQHGESL
jgi:hypothetical protein